MYREFEVVLGGVFAKYQPTMLAAEWQHSVRLKYSQEYILVEGTAKRKKRGLWAGQFVEPWEWRRGNRMSSAAANDNRAINCEISHRGGRKPLQPARRYGPAGNFGNGIRIGKHPKDTDRPGDVLDLDLAQVFEGEFDSVADLVAHRTTDTDFSRRRQFLQARRDIDPIAVYVLALNDDVAKVDADTELDAACFRYVGISFGHTPLHFDSALHGLDDTGKLKQQAVAHGLDDTTTMVSNLKVD